MSVVFGLDELPAAIPASVTSRVHDSQFQTESFSQGILLALGTLCLNRPYPRVPDVTCALRNSGRLSSDPR